MSKEILLYELLFEIFIDIQNEKASPNAFVGFTNCCHFFIVFKRVNIFFIVFIRVNFFSLFCYKS